MYNINNDKELCYVINIYSIYKAVEYFELFSNWTWTCSEWYLISNQLFYDEQKSLVEKVSMIFNKHFIQSYLGNIEPQWSSEVNWLNSDSTQKL